MFHSNSSQEEFSNVAESKLLDSTTATKLVVVCVVVHPIVIILVTLIACSLIIVLFIVPLLDFLSSAQGVEEAKTRAFARSKRTLAEITADLVQCFCCISASELNAASG